MTEFNGLKAFNLKDAKRVVGLKSTSYKDYLAARHLINANFLHQGAIMMNTCLERALKVYLIVNDKNIDTAKHDTFKLFNSLKQLTPEIASPLKPDFFKILAKIYRSRYYEGLNTGYNFVIVKNQFLAEFDFSFDYLDSLTRIKLERDKDVPETKYELDKKEGNKILETNNHLLNKLSKEEYLKQPEYVYEFRIAPNHEIIEVMYRTSFTINPSIFIHEGLKILPDNRSVKLSQYK